MAKNVWQKNEIPPLEFCPIDRAARLLSCEINDILNWIDAGKIEPLMEFGFSTVRAFMGVKLDPDKNPSLEDRLCDRYLGEVKRLSNWNMRPLRPMGECDSYDDITMLEFPAYFSGIAKVAEGLIYESGTSFVILPQDLYCEVIVNRELKSKPDPDDESCFLGVEFIRFTSIMSDYDDAVAINLDASQLFLYREDIERIYTYGLAGEDLPRVWLTDLSQSNQLSVSSMAFGRKVTVGEPRSSTSCRTLSICRGLTSSTFIFPMIGMMFFCRLLRKSSGCL